MASPISIVASNGVAFLLVGICTGLYERTLIPLYGASPTKQYLFEFIALSISLGYFQRCLPLTTSQRWMFMSFMFLMAPFGVFWLGALTARWHRPFAGPAATHLACLMPLVSSISATFPIAGTRPWNIVCQLLLAGSAYFLLPKIAYFVHNIILLVPNPDGKILHGFAVLSYLFSWFTYQPPQQPEKNLKKKGKQPKAAPPSSGWPTPVWVSTLLLALPLHRPLSSPILQHPLLEPYNHPELPITILSSVESVTGLIVVGQLNPSTENQDLSDQMHSVRFLRADHSFLGGVWTGMKAFTLEGWAPVLDSFGDELGDSIYSTFVLQESVLLAKHRTFKNGLIIGLGTGISAAGFMRRGVDTTIVEIDPAVYNAARTYFALPDPGKDRVFLEDARSWVGKRRIDSGDRFDFVVHDCFSGGGVPEHIFTLEFFQELKSIMHEDGVLVLNVAGVVKSESIRLVFRTITQVFPRCRGYHDQLNLDLTDEQYENDLINIVWFCTTAAVELQFRESGEDDWMGSPLRRHVLNNLQAREIPSTWLAFDEGDTKNIITDSHNRLGKLQDALGFHHWEVMRDVMKDEYWEVF